MQGRDYTDVSPLKGCYSGEGVTGLDIGGDHPAGLAQIRGGFSPPMGATVAWAAGQLPARAVVAAATAAVAVPDPAGSAEPHLADGFGAVASSVHPSH